MLFKIVSKKKDKNPYGFIIEEDKKIQEVIFLNENEIVLKVPETVSDNNIFPSMFQIDKKIYVKVLFRSRLILVNKIFLENL
jgi:hypothetical protein